MRTSSRDDRGQALVEFVLVAPFLFLVFFALLQGAAIAWTALGVQRSALAAARHAARAEGEGRAWDSPRLQALVALAPWASLHRSCLAALLMMKVEVERGPERLTATVRFPMPLWMPLAGPLLGERLIVPRDTLSPEMRRLFTTAFRLAGRTPPDLGTPFQRLPCYRWLVFQASEPLPRPLGSDPA